MSSCTLQVSELVLFLQSEFHECDLPKPNSSKKLPSRQVHVKNPKSCFSRIFPTDDRCACCLARHAIPLQVILPEWFDLVIKLTAVFGFGVLLDVLALSRFRPDLLFESLIIWRSFIGKVGTQFRQGEPSIFLGRDHAWSAAANTPVRPWLYQFWAQHTFRQFCLFISSFLPDSLSWSIRE